MVRQYQLKLPAPYLWEKLQFSDNQATSWSSTGKALVTIATLAALKASTELKGHVPGALRNGCTVEEVQDVLLQSAVYCGVPSGIEAFRAAKEVIEKWQSSENG